VRSSRAKLPTGPDRMQAGDATEWFLEPDDGQRHEPTPAELADQRYWRERTRRVGHRGPRHRYRLSARHRGSQEQLRTTRSGRAASCSRSANEQLQHQLGHRPRRRRPTLTRPIAAFLATLETSNRGPARRTR